MLEHYDYFLKVKDTKPVKQSKIITHKSTFENLNIVDIESVIMYKTG